MTETVDRARVFGDRAGFVERIAPGFFKKAFEDEHIARYRWASRWVEGQVVLDIACGTGYGASILRAAGAGEVIGMDQSSDALTFGSARYDFTPVRGDGHALPFERATIDRIVSLETIEHLETPILFLREAWRILRIGGELLLSSPNTARTAGVNPFHLCEMTLEELRRVVGEAGFRVTGIWGQHWGLPRGPWHRVRGLRRLLWEIERYPGVTPVVPIGLRPMYWCLRALKHQK